MNDHSKTKAQLVAELQKIRREVLKLEKTARAAKTTPAPRAADAKKEWQKNPLFHKTVDKHHRPAADAVSESHHIKILQTQRKLALAVNRAKTFNETLALCLQSAIDIADMDSGGVYLVNDNTNMLDLVCHQGLSKKFINQVSHFEASSPSFKTVLAGKPVFSEYDELLDRLSIKRSERLRAAAIIPIIMKNRVIASFNVASHSRNRIEKPAQLALEAIAAQIGEYINRAKAEEALKKSEGQLRLILENTIDTITLNTFDNQVTYLYVNPSIKRVLGYDPHELIGRSIFDFVHPLDKEPLALGLNNHLKQAKRAPQNVGYHTTDTVEFRFRTKKGEWRCMQSILTPIGNQLLGVTRDITDHKRMEQAVILMSDTQRQLARLNTPDQVFRLVGQKIQELIGSGFVTICIFDEQNKIHQTMGFHGLDDLYKELVRSFNLDPSSLALCRQELSGDEQAKITSGKLEEYKPGIHGLLKRRLPKKVCTTIAKQLQFTGVYIIGLVHQNRYFGSITILTPKDITPYAEMIATSTIQAAIELVRIEAEQKLRASEEHYRMLAENSTDIIWLSDLSLKPIYISPSITKQRGYTLDELRALPLEKQLAPASLQRALQAFHEFATPERLARTDQPIAVTLDQELYCKDGSTFWSEITYLLLYDKNGQPVHILGTGRDITERKRAEEVIIAQRDLAKAIGKTKSIEEGLLLSLDIALQVTGMDSGGIYLFENADSSLKLATHRGLGADFIETVSCFPADSENAQQVRAGKMALFPQDLIPDVEPYRSEQIRCLAAMPIFFQERAIGSLNIASHTLCEIPYSALTSLETIAAEIGNFFVYLQADTAVRASEERYRQLVEISPDAIVIIRDSRIVYINPAGVVMAGAGNIEEIFGRPLSNFAHPARLQEAADLVRRSVEQRLPIKLLDEELVRLDGAITKVEVTAIPTAFQGMPAIQLIIHDITDRALVLEARKAEEERFRKLIEHSSDISAILSPEGTEKYVSESLERITGFKPSDCIGKNGFDFLHPEDVPHMRQVLANIIAFPLGIHKAEYRHRTKNGDWVVLEAVGSNRLNDPTINGIVLNVRDISERKQAEQALQESKERYQQLFEFSPDGIVILDPHTLRFMQFNEKAYAQLGYTRTEFAQLRLSEIEVAETPEEIKSHLARVMDNGHHTFETRHRTKQGGIRDVRVTAQVLHVAGTPIYHGIWRDITEQKLLEAQLRQSQKMEAIGQMAGGIAHDFNNILSPILGYTDMALQALPEQDPLFADLQHVLKGAQRAKDLVSQILLFAKKIEIKQQPLLLQSVLAEALKLLRPSIPSTIRILLHVDERCETVHADFTQMHQVIVNLCNNAWQAMEEQGGTLTIELKQVHVSAETAELHTLPCGHYVQLSVMDSGPGMDEETKTHIFEPFYTTKAVNKGTGLGLSVVLGIVQSHRGYITVESQPGQGSDFNVYLPVLSETSSFPATEPRAMTGGKESILVVDDEEIVVKVVGRMLVKLGYKIKTCTSSVEALNVFLEQQDRYDVLLTDLTMPNLTGLELAAEMRKRRSEIPIIIMTGFGSTLDEATRKSFGIKQVIGKPVVMSELDMALRNLLS